LDNLPFERVRRTPEGLVQVWVDVSDDQLVAVEQPIDPTLAEITPKLEFNEEAAVSREALGFVAQVARALERGYALLIDYGEATGRSPGPVHGYLRHRAVDDVFANPGASDITAGVNFRAIIETAKDSGLEAFGPVSQRVALAGLGFSEWNEEERRRQVELLDQREGTEAIRAFGSRSRASLLLDPAGLGGLSWLVLKTRDCEWPPWLEEAAAREKP
jgi:SAM-dependent MidA family methyltransferase